MASNGFIVDEDNFGNCGRQLHSHAPIYSAVLHPFLLPVVSSLRQTKNLEADGVEPASTLSKPPTDRAEERHMSGLRTPAISRLAPSGWSPDGQYAASTCQRQSPISSPG